MKVAHFHFDEGIAGLLLGRRGTRDLELQFTGPQSIKHLIESLGIPHTEVGQIQANGHPIRMDYQVQPGDELVISVALPDLDVLVEPRFILDGHLGRLASRLRMLGLDCLYRADADDPELASTSIGDSRILLTRDRRLLMRKTLTQGYLVRSQIPREQLREIVDRYRLRPWIKPFERCIRCNALLEPVSKEQVLERLEPLTRLYYHEFRICPACHQIYWKGSHIERMVQLIADLGDSRA